LKIKTLGVVRQLSKLVESIEIECPPDGFECNERKCTNAVRSVISKLDSEIREEYEEAVFGNSGELTGYGKSVVLANYCVVWLYSYFCDEDQQFRFFKKIENSDYEDIESAYLSYAIYWHLGDDFLIRVVIEQVLEQLIKLEIFKNPTRYVESKADSYKIDKTMRLIVDDMLKLKKNHYSPKARSHLALDEPEEKERFREELRRELDRL
jgi:hypothetical protein